MVRWVLPVSVFALLWSSSASARSFEQQMQKAGHIKKLATVIGPFLQHCGAGARLDDIQCRAIRARMQHRVRQGTFWSTVPAVQVGPYNNARLNFPLSVVGCLTCKAPANLDKQLYGGSPWYVTTGNPRTFKLKDGKPSFTGLELKRLIQPVGPSQVEGWMRSKLPNLKVQMIYRVDGTLWPKRLGTGLTVNLLGYRLYNQCSGKILASDPPSTGSGPILRTASCGANAAVIRREAPRRATVPLALAPRAIQIGMKRIGALVQECYDRFQVPGLAVVRVTVKGATGQVAGVKIKGKFKGSPTTGRCLIDAVKKARFHIFRKAKMSFSYRWYLR